MWRVPASSGPEVATPLRVAALAGRQHGAVTRAQLRELGVADRTVSKWVHAGLLHRIHRGVFAVGHAALSQEGKWMAAVLAGGERAVLSHRSAAQLWGLIPGSFALTDISTSGSARRIERVAVHRTRRLQPHEVTTHRGIRTTTVQRTLTDFADRATRAELQRARHQAEIRYGVTPSPINGRRGAGRLKEERDPSRSRLERVFKRLCKDRGLPLPQHNVFVEGAERDFVWVEHRLVVEVDGWETHSTRHAFEADRARDQDLVRAGWRVLRFTWRQVLHDPRRVAATIRATLAPAASAPGRATPR